MFLSVLFAHLLKRLRIRDRSSTRLAMVQITLTGMLLCECLVRPILRFDEILILFLDKAGIRNAFILIMLKAEFKE